MSRPFVRDGFSAAAMRLGARRCAPLLAGVVPFGLVVGLLSHGQGLTLTEAGLMSGLCYAGSAQILALSHWSAPAPIVAASLAALVVNLRLVLMGPVLAPWLDRLHGWRLAGSLFMMADQNWALSVEAMRRGEADGAFLFGSGALMWVVWVATRWRATRWAGSCRRRRATRCSLPRSRSSWRCSCRCGAAGGMRFLGWSRGWCRPSRHRCCRAAGISCWARWPAALRGCWRNGGPGCMSDAATLLAIAGMAVATFGCRFGGYWVFSHIRPSPTLRTALGYVPGALFVSYVVPALVAAGSVQWVGAAATLALMLRTRNLSVAILGGTGLAWTWWSFRFHRREACARIAELQMKVALLSHGWQDEATNTC